MSYLVSLERDPSFSEIQEENLDLQMIEATKTQSSGWYSNIQRI